MRDIVVLHFQRGNKNRNNAYVKYWHVCSEENSWTGAGWLLAFDGVLKPVSLGQGPRRVRCISARRSLFRT
jgi:hypothetical protein